MAAAMLLSFAFHAVRFAWIAMTTPRDDAGE
jgi:hypothetical protein